MAPAKQGTTAAAGAGKAGTAARSTSAQGGSVGMKAGVNTSARQLEGKKTMSKGGAQASSKASVKTANKAAAKTDKNAGKKASAPKAVKGKGAATKSTPRGRHGAMVPQNTLR